MNADIPTDPKRTAAPREYFPGLFLQVASRLALRLDEEVCRDGPVRPHIAGVLFTIQTQPGIRQGLCAENLGFDATTFGRYIDRMVRDGLVDRSVPPEDRRAVSLTLTDKGREAIEHCSPILAELEGDIRARMGDEDWDKLTLLLARFLDAYDHPLPRLVDGTMVRAD